MDALKLKLPLHWGGEARFTACEVEFLEMEIGMPNTLDQGWSGRPSETERSISQEYTHLIYLFNARSIIVEFASISISF